MKLYISMVGALVALLLVQIGSAAPGDIIWQQTLGGPAGEEWGYSLDSTADGGLLVTGSAYSEDANISGAHTNGDLWVVKMNSSGVPLWNRAFGGNESDYGLSVKTTADGGSVIIGTTGSYDGDITGYHGNGDLWILKLSASGNPEWQKVYGGNRTDEGGDILQTDDGGYALTGYTMSDDGDASGHHGGGDLWMVRLDPKGSILWQKTFGGTKRDSGSSIVKTSDGGYAMTGNTYSTDGDVTMNHGSSDLWVVKTDAQGNLLWQKTFGGSKLDWGHSLVELPGGDLIVAGVTASSDGDVSMNHGAGDIWVIRLTSDGRKIWEKTYGGSFSDNVWKVEPSPSGGVYLTGESFSVDGDFSGNHGDADLLISEIDGNGSLVWYRTLGGQNYESGAWLKRMSDGNLTICGTTQSFDGDVTGGRGGGDLWVVKVDGGTGSLPMQNISLVTNTTQVPGVAPVIQSPALNNTPVVAANNTSQVSTTVAPVFTPVQNISPVTNTTQTPGVVPVVQTPAVNATPAVAANMTNSISAILLPIPGVALPPRDPDGDGQYEDLNGNGKIDLQDPSVFFTNYEWIVVNYPPQAGDFNKNGGIDFGDINALFMEVSG